MKNLRGFCLILLLAQTFNAQAGGGFTITQSVISSGGQQSAGDGFIVGGTVGQTTAGTNSTGGNFSVRDGFWTFDQFMPTAAQASLGGRVFSGKGLGIIRRVRVRLLDTITGIERTTQTNQYGFYRFDELEVGRIYIVRAESKIYAFTPDSYLMELLETREEINFTGVNTLPLSN